jgi:hypothetical protein
MIKEYFLPKYYKIFVNEDSGEIKIISNSKHKKGREISQTIDKKGYIQCKLNNKTIALHRIIAKLYFGELPKGYCVNHKDSNKLNNHPNNLEYITLAENTIHSIKMGLHICNRPELLPTYKDGRTRDKVKYKHDWYMKNRERILLKVKERYYASK